MRLFLSSFRFGDRLDLLRGLVGSNGRIGVIANALDAVPAVARADYARNVYDPIADLVSHGFDAALFDLRSYFGKQEKLESALAQFDMVWASGGNAFLLRRAMRQSGFDRIALPLIGSGKLAYGGESAGAVVATPNLKGMELMDDPNELAAGYAAAAVWEGLNLIPFHLVPHYDSANAHAMKAEQVTVYLLDQAMPYRTMRDGDVLVRDRNGLKAYERS